MSNLKDFNCSPFLTFSHCCRNFMAATLLFVAILFPLCHYFSAVSLVRNSLQQGIIMYLNNFSQHLCNRHECQSKRSIHNFSNVGVVKVHYYMIALQLQEMSLFCSLELAATSAAASKTESSTDVIGRTFNTPLRASAVANLAQKDKSAEKSAGLKLAQKFVTESVETSSRASSVPGDAQDVARGCVIHYFVISLITCTCTIIMIICLLVDLRMHSFEMIVIRIRDPRSL